MQSNDETQLKKWAVEMALKYPGNPYGAINDRAKEIFLACQNLGGFPMRVEAPVREQIINDGFGPIVWSQRPEHRGGKI